MPASSPSSADELPTVLMLGGILEGTASAILTYLRPSNTSKLRKASYIRIADKFLILPQSDTFLKWVHPDARRILKDGYGEDVEYMQANIVGGFSSGIDWYVISYCGRTLLAVVIQALADARTKVFKAPNNKPFDIVFDFTAGSVTSGAATEEIMVQVRKDRAVIVLAILHAQSPLQ